MRSESRTLSMAAPLLAVVCRGRRAGVIVNEHELSAEQTRDHVDCLSRWFDFIHHDELIDRLARRRGRPFCLMTFDDGKRGNYLEVAPVLERLGVPAAFYVVTGRLSDGQPLWFDRHAALVRTLGRVPAGLELSRLKTIPYAQVREVLDRACLTYGITAESVDPGALPMSWAQAQDLARRGFTVGAHGVNHLISTNETELEARAQIDQSIDAVTIRTGQPCRSFAFPNGSYTPSLAAYAHRAGATTVMTTDPLWVDNSSALWMLPRVQLFGEHSRTRIEAKLAVAGVGRWLPNPDGTGRRCVRRERRPAPCMAEPEAK